MRHAIESAPKDETFVILEDDASGIYDVAHWSPEAGQWVGENSEPSKITPTHWHPMARDKYLLREDEGSSSPSRLGPSVWRWCYHPFISVTAAAALLFFYVARDSGQPDITRIGEQVAAQATQLLSLVSKTALLAPRQTEANQASVLAEAQQAAQLQQIAVASVPEARRSLNGERAEASRAIERRDVLLRARELRAALASELATARREIETQAQLRKASEEAEQLKRTETATTAQALRQEREKTAALALEAAAARRELTASTAQHRQALHEEHARSAALASELATAQREIETQAAQLRKAGDQTEQLKQAEAAKNEQALRQEREQTAALALEAAAARQELTGSTAQHRHALHEERARSAALASELATAQREFETQAAQLRQASDEAEQLKQATESAMADLRHSLQQERDRTAAMARDLESAQRTVGARVPPEPATSSQISKAQAVAVAAMAQPAAAEAQSSPEATRLLARAGALLGQGDIGAARIVLERAAETGSARASFMLAETYDPGILSAWGTYGTRGEVTRARELYAKAHAGGIQEAEDRFNALRQ